MTIHADVRELTSIHGEMRNMREQLKKLRSAADAVQSRIIESLVSNEEDGVTFNEYEILLSKKKKTGRKKKADIEKDTVDVLSGYVANPQLLLKKLDTARRKAPVEIPTLKFKPKRS